MMKKATALALTIAMLVPMISVANAEDTATEPEVTVVTKLIKDGTAYDPNYLEISLEVNGDYEDYSAVGVVLAYDADVITPAADWDGTDGESAVMTDNTSWATRRALPTLGNDMWTSHTALAYEVEETDSSSGTPVTKHNGYLYLGAEYPGVVQNTASPAASPAATAEAGDGSSEEPTAAPDTDDPYVNPVVVARFVFKNPYDSSADTGIGPEQFKAAWKLDNAADSWQKDWEKNKYITIAGDDIAAKSPAEYGFAYYYADMTEKVYMYTWPSPHPTADTSATAAPTVDPESTFAPYTPPPVGQEFVEDKPLQKLTKDDIEIVLGEGKSAKATGGLSLNDVFAIILFDWDNSFLGAVTAGLGVDATEAVNSFVKTQLIHPDLRNKDYAELDTAGTITQRQYNYRGEYPFTGPQDAADSSNPAKPGGANTYPDVLDANGNNTDPNAGSQFPLTNKLEYCFAGKDIDADYPFANGWTAVVTSIPDYTDTTVYPGYKAKTMPTYMETTFTSLDTTQTYGRMPELDANGDFVDTTLNANDIPDVVAFDFKAIEDMDKEDLNAYGGNIYVKAVYTPGEMWNRVSTSNDSSEANYAAIGPMKSQTITSTSASTTYGFSFDYRRINKYGYGVRRINESSVRMDMTQLGATSSTPIQLLVTNKDVINVLLTPTNAVRTIGYRLVDSYNYNVVTGTSRSLDTELGSVSVGGPEGVGFKIQIKPYLDMAHSGTSGTWFTLAIINSFYFTSNSNGTAYAARTYTAAQTQLVALVAAAGNDYEDLTWYQIQYALINTGAYVDKATAKAWCESYPSLSANAAKV